LGNGIIPTTKVLKIVRETLQF